jgi:hypothetical protein
VLTSAASSSAITEPPTAVPLNPLLMGPSNPTPTPGPVLQPPSSVSVPLSSVASPSALSSKSGGF